MVKKLVAVLSVLCFVAPPVYVYADEKSSREATVEVVPDRTRVRVNEEFSVRFLVTSKEKNAVAPDWNPLKKNFRVRQGGKKLRSKSVGGVRRTVNEWRVYLRPRRTGELKIPPLAFGTARSKAVPITVQAQGKKKSTPSKDFFVEVEAVPDDPYVQAQVLFTLRVFMSRSLRGSVSPPKSDRNALVESLGEARKYRERRDGRSYEVYARQYLIYPQTSGKMSIKPVRVTGSYISGNRSFSVDRKSQSLVLNVRQVPPSFPGKFWLPAERFSIKEQWSSGLSSWKAGEPLKRKLKLEAKGLLAKQLPEVNLPSTEGFRSYTEPAEFRNSRTDSGIVGKVEQSLVLIPAQSGAYTLPGFKMPWWNTRADRLEFAELPEKTVTIGETDFGSLIVNESEPAVSDLLEPAVTEAAGAGSGGGVWFWVSMISLSGWLMTGAAMWWGSTLCRRFRFMYERRGRIRDTRKLLQKACQANDPVQAREALFRWSESMWPVDPPMSVSGIGARCGGAVEQHVRELERVLYGGGDAEWHGKALWESMSMQEISNDTEDAQDVRILQPLHRL